MTTVFKIFVDDGFPGFLEVLTILKFMSLVRILVKLNREKAIMISASIHRDICLYEHVLLLNIYLFQIYMYNTEKLSLTSMCRSSKLQSFSMLLRGSSACRADIQSCNHILNDIPIS